MRIISGMAKGTKLYSLEGNNTRPTLDRVKESIFNIINKKILDADVLDLFSGSGSIGLEFASRGANKVVLCDISNKACQIIKKNIEKTHLDGKVELYNMDFKKLISNFKNIKFDIIFLDPPYETNFIIKAIKLLINTNMLKDSTLIIAETDNDKKITQEIEKIDIRMTDKRKYGRAYIIFLEKFSRKEE